MKIIQNNYTKENDVSEEYYVCEECNSVFEYEDYDIYRYKDEDGIERVDCPCCGQSCIIYTPITEDNIKFPKSFYQFGVRDGAVEIDNKEITFWIKDCISWLKNNPNEPYKYVGSGDTFLCVFNHEDEYYIMVAKNYFDTSIDK